MKWQESTVELGFLNMDCSHIYEIGNDKVIGDVTYKEILVDGSVAKLWVREEGNRVWLLADEYPHEIKLYDFNWNEVGGPLFTEYLRERGDDVELKREESPITYKTICLNGKYYQFHQEGAGIVIRNIGRVYELNRNSSLLGYKIPEEILPGLIYWKVLWIEKDGEVFFKSDSPCEWSAYWAETVVSIDDKCATPTIAYDKGRLVFSCETPGAECVYEIKCADTGSGRGSEVSLNKTYEIRAHATLDGWDDSDVAVATIGWRNGQPVMEGFSSVTLDSGDSGGDVNGDGKVDVADITAIISYMSQEGRRDYVPFVEEGKAWYCEYDHFDVDQPPLKDPMGNSIDCIFTMHGDTLINDREYKKVYCQFEEYYGDKEQHYYCAVREKAYQVFIIEGGTMEEKLIYDFNHPKELINITYNGFKFARTGGYHRYDYLPGQLEYSVCSYSGNEVDYSNGSSYWFDGVGAPLNNPFAFELPFLPFDEPKLGKDIVVRTCMKDGKCIYMLDWLAEPIEPYKDDRGQVPVTPVK
jgi:hypothetical protein